MLWNSHCLNYTFSHFYICTPEISHNLWSWKFGLRSWKSPGNPLVIMCMKPTLCYVILSKTVSAAERKLTFITYNNRRVIYPWAFLSPRSATGREVFDWILDQGYYSERDTSNVVRQVLEAVAYLHSLHIVHRNLKVTICTHTTSLTFDLTSDQEKLPRNRKKHFTSKEREETFRRATDEDPSPGWTEVIYVM